AGLSALTGDHPEVEEMHQAYSERRSWIVPAINAIDGIRCDDPDGAFYIFPEVKGVFGRGNIRDSHTFAEFLLEHARVAVVPGIAFGWDDHVRISYATSIQRIPEAARPIQPPIPKPYRL